jgi:hypothetical protein
MVNNKMSAIKRYLLGKGASEELLQIMTQNVSKRVVQAPSQNRGQVAAWEQIKILKEALANETGEQALPLNRGQVAAQEQFRIMREALGISNA